MKNVIWKKAGVTTGALYFFFKDKNDLFAALVSKMIINKIYPYMVSNVSAGMNAIITPQSYQIMVVIILCAYTVVNFMVGRH